MSVTPDAVERFLRHFEQIAMEEDFDLLEAMIDERAYFRFNDGDFIGPRRSERRSRRRGEATPRFGRRASTCPTSLC